MENLTHEKQFAEMVRRLRDFFRPQKIILFGSRARGDHRMESDYDLVLIVKNSELSSLKRMKKAQEILWGIWLPADILVFTELEVEELRAIPSSIVTTALEEGQVIYAA